MRLHARVGREAVAWLHAHPQEIGAFRVALARATADELMLLQESTPLHHPNFPYMQRFFRFGKKWIAVFEWKHAERSVRVHTILDTEWRPPAA
jgi:hypothetical protein